MTKEARLLCGIAVNIRRALLFQHVYAQGASFDTPPKMPPKGEITGYHSPGLSFEGGIFKEQQTTFV